MLEKETMLDVLEVRIIAGGTRRMRFKWRQTGGDAWVSEFATNQSRLLYLESAPMWLAPPPTGEAGGAEGEAAEAGGGVSPGGAAMSSAADTSPVTPSGHRARTATYALQSVALARTHARTRAPRRPPAHWPAIGRALTPLAGWLAGCDGMCLQRGGGGGGGWWRCSSQGRRRRRPVGASRRGGHRGRGGGRRRGGAQAHDEPGRGVRRRLGEPAQAAGGVRLEGLQVCGYWVAVPRGLQPLRPNMIPSRAL
jgi:hypothetical protein